MSWEDIREARRSRACCSRPGATQANMFRRLVERLEGRRDA